MQTITSEKTSQNQIPALHKWYAANETAHDVTVVDYGCGKYDTGIDFLRDAGFSVLPFDPYNREWKENMVAAFCLNHGGNPVVLVANVLNVIAEEEERSKAIHNASLGSVAYFTVYEGDRSGMGKETTKGFQMNRKTVDYMAEIEKHFANVQREGKVIIASN